MKKLPIIFYHRGNPSYLKRVIEQAEKWNQEVWLIGDESNKTCALHWINCEELKSDLFAEFQKNYEHMSTRPYENEMFCFESHFRYFELARKMGWEKFITMDSDVLVFQTFTEEMFKSADAAFGWTESEKKEKISCDPFVTFWTVDAMKDFVTFCVEQFLSNKEALREKWQYHIDNKINGGVCDMTLLTMWKQTTRYKVKNIAHEENGQVFDLSVAVSKNEYLDEYAVSASRKLKKMKFRKEIPYLQKKDGRWVRANVLHCNGHNKKCIKYLQRGVSCPIPYMVINYWSALKIIVKHTLRKLNIKGFQV